MLCKNYFLWFCTAFQYVYMLMWWNKYVQMVNTGLSVMYFALSFYLVEPRKMKIYNFCDDILNQHEKLILFVR